MRIDLVPQVRAFGLAVDVVSKGLLLAAPQIGFLVLKPGISPVLVERQRARNAHATRWNLSIERATTGSMVAERTAAVIWSMLALVPASVFLWNVFPLHPHEPDDPFSNRSHRPDERAAGEELLAELIAMLRPRRLVAIGNDAARTASKMAALTAVSQVRHPSYGGQREFVRQIRDLYSLPSMADQPRLL